VTADRKNDGKVALSYILDAPYAMAGMCDVMAFGAQKYARCNWQQGFPRDQLIDSLLRHLMALHNGETHDPESGLSHADHVLCNAVFLADQYNGRRDNG